MQGLRVISRVAVVACLLCLAAEPSLSQAPQERVPLIMSGLPAVDAPAYAAIRNRVPNAPIQVLRLSKAEVWSVLPEEVSDVRKVAAQHGVSVSGLGADWNSIFRPGAMGMARDGIWKMSAEQQAIINRARSLRATMAVAMIGMPKAAQVEYALTREADLPAPAHGSPAIKVNLNDKTAVTIVRTSVTVGSDKLVWRGNVEGTGEPAMLMWWPGVRMAGTIHYNGRIYSIRCLRGQMHAIIEMSQDRMPPEHAPMSQRMRADHPSLHDDPLVEQGDASMLRPAIAVRPPVMKVLPDVGPPDSAAPTKDIVINVIVAYTKKAARNYSDIEHELLDLAIEEANQSFRNSNLAQIKLKLVHAYETDYVEEGTYFDHVWRFADKDDGYMEEIHGLRDKYDADVAVLIVDDPTGCGLATRVYADADEAFAVVGHQCAALTYSLAHEIGHIIGARHELKVDRTMTPFPYGHGYVNGVKWRDIMSYKESCGGCPRLPVWSSPRITVNGEPAGSTSENNARVLGEQAERVANFRSSRRGNRAYSAGPRERGIDAADPR